ncbi:polysaccharide deacetylase family protein [Candidatus Saccharibacteria bacterium]|nr:polysaccharide deacetylase family protein [Candidatus Saccharibacteria bacterium]
MKQELSDVEKKRRTRTRRRVAIISSIAILLLGITTCLLLYFFWPQTDESSRNANVSIEELPKIQADKDWVTVCPSGKLQDFKLSVLDEKDGDITDSAKRRSLPGGVLIEATDSDGNYVSKVLAAKYEDNVAPQINLNGESYYSILVGGSLELPAVTATDNCDGQVEVETTGSYDVDTVGQYIIKYRAKDAAGNVSTAEREINVTNNSGVIYLTFDDGPGPYTEHLLDILKANNVKATFFVTGAGSDAVLKREYDEGHAIGLHTYSHVYSYIYESVDNYFADLEQVQQRVKDVTGYTTKLIRFPGGTSNTISRNYDGGARIMSQLSELVKEKGYTYFDWNIASGDAGSASTADQVYNNVISRLVPNHDYVILQHDIKSYSVDAVERIIEYGKSQGFTFKKLDENSFTAAHGVNN